MNEKNKYDIDEFAQALLDSKTEQKINQLDSIDIETPEPEEVQRKIAENELSSALDFLRKERGEIIEEPKHVEEVVETVVETEESKDDEEEIKEEIPTPQPKVERKPKPKKTKTLKKPKIKNYTKFKMTGFLVVLLLLSLLLCGYAYKTIVYDPAHNVSPKQQKYYDKFVSYADEWDMLSDAEKNELLSLQKTYASLNDTQKTQLNAYYKEQTGKTYTTIIKQLKETKQNKDDEKNVVYIEINNFLTNWKTYDDATKAMVVNYKASFKELSPYLQEQLNELSEEKTNKSFLSLVSKYEKSIEAEQKALALQSAGLTSDQAKELLIQTQDELKLYQEYGEELKQQAKNPEQYGTDTESVNLAIQANNQTIAELQSQVDYYKELLSIDTD